MKKKVLLAVESLTPGSGGISRVARLTARVLAEMSQRDDLDVYGVSLSDLAIPSEIGLRAVACQGSRWKYLYHVQRHSLHCTHCIYDVTGMARSHVVGKILNRRLACWIHGIEIWKEPKMTPRKTRARRIAKSADILFANSQTTVERSGYSHAHKCWLSTESDELVPVTDENRPPRVLLLSTITVDYKGHQQLLDCWSQVKRVVPNARLTFAGKGPGLERLRQTVANHPHAESIEVLGFVPEQELDSLYASSSLLAMPSRGEGFGLVYIEAMRHALPVIASIHDAGGEVNIDGVTGYNVNLDEPQQLPDRLIQLLGDPRLARSLGLQAQQRWQSEFSYSCFKRRFTPLLSEFLQR